MIRPGDASIGDVRREPTLKVIMLRKGEVNLLIKITAIFQFHERLVTRLGLRVPFELDLEPGRKRGRP